MIYQLLASILDEVNIDFEPLYRCIHVYETLGKRNEFKTSYSEDRRVSKKYVEILMSFTKCKLFFRHKQIWLYQHLLT